MFSVRIVKVDHYIAPPVRGLDVCYSEFRNCQLTKVPVIRIFGPTPAGQKVCVHLHGTFPYIYIPYDGTEPADHYMRQLAAKLDQALATNQAGTDCSNAHWVHKIELVSGIPFYGYHAKEHQFLKIYFLNPQIIERAVELLQSGAIMNHSFQPHEAHIPYILQVFVDYNLYGMNLIKFQSVKFRRKCAANHPMGSKGSLDFPDSSHLSNNSTDSACESFKLWDPDNEPSAFASDDSIKKQSTCELEVDVLNVDVLNSLDFAGSDMNPGIAAIWEDERQRRRQNNQMSQITPPCSQDRQPTMSTRSEIEYLEKVKKKICLVADSQEMSILNESQVHGKSGVEAKSLCDSDLSLLSQSQNSTDYIGLQGTSNVCFSQTSNKDSVLDDNDFRELLLDLMETESVNSVHHDHSRSPTPPNLAAKDDDENDEIIMSQIILDDNLDAELDTHNSTAICDNSAIPRNDGIPQLDGANDPKDECHGASNTVCSDKPSPMKIRSSPRKILDEAKCNVNCGNVVPILTEKDTEKSKCPNITNNLKRKIPDSANTVSSTEGINSDVAASNDSLGCEVNTDCATGENVSQDLSVRPISRLSLRSHARLKLVYEERRKFMKNLPIRQSLRQIMNSKMCKADGNNSLACGENEPVPIPPLNSVPTRRTRANVSAVTEQNLFEISGLGASDLVPRPRKSRLSLRRDKNDSKEVPENAHDSVNYKEQEVDDIEENTSESQESNLQGNSCQRSRGQGKRGRGRGCRGRNLQNPVLSNDLLKCDELASNNDAICAAATDVNLKRTWYRSRRGRGRNQRANHAPKPVLEVSKESEETPKENELDDQDLNGLNQTTLSVNENVPDSIEEKPGQLISIDSEVSVASRARRTGRLSIRGRGRGKNRGGGGWKRIIRDILGENGKKSVSEPLAEMPKQAEPASSTEEFDPKKPPSTPEMPMLSISSSLRESDDPVLKEPPNASQPLPVTELELPVLTDKLDFTESCNLTEMPKLFAVSDRIELPRQEESPTLSIKRAVGRPQKNKLQQDVINNMWREVCIRGAKVKVNSGVGLQELGKLGFECLRIRKCHFPASKTTSNEINDLDLKSKSAIDHLPMSETSMASDSFSLRKPLHTENESGELHQTVNKTSEDRQQSTERTPENHQTVDTESEDVPQSSGMAIEDLHQTKDLASADLREHRSSAMSEASMSSYSFSLSKPLHKENESEDHHQTVNKTSEDLQQSTVKTPVDLQQFTAKTPEDLQQSTAKTPEDHQTVDMESVDVPQSNGMALEDLHQAMELTSEDLREHQSSAKSNDKKIVSDSPACDVVHDGIKEEDEQDVLTDDTEIYEIPPSSKTIILKVSKVMKNKLGAVHPNEHSIADGNITSNDNDTKSQVWKCKLVGRDAENNTNSDDDSDESLRLTHKGRKVHTIIDSSYEEESQKADISSTEMIYNPSGSSNTSETDVSWNSKRTASRSRSRRWRKKKQRRRRIVVCTESDDEEEEKSLRKARRPRRTSNCTKGKFDDFIVLTSGSESSVVEVGRRGRRQRGCKKIAYCEDSDYDSQDVWNSVDKFQDRVIQMRPTKRRTGVDYAPNAYASFYDPEAIGVEGWSSTLKAGHADDFIHDDDHELLQKFQIKSSFVRLERLDEETVEKYVRGQLPFSVPVEATGLSEEIPSASATQVLVSGPPYFAPASSSTDDSTDGRPTSPWHVSENATDEDLSDANLEAWSTDKPSGTYVELGDSPTADRFPSRVGSPKKTQLEKTQLDDEERYAVCEDVLYKLAWLSPIPEKEKIVVRPPVLTLLRTSSPTEIKEADAMTDMVSSAAQASQPASAPKQSLSIQQHDNPPRHGSLPASTQQPADPVCSAQNTSLLLPQMLNHSHNRHTHSSNQGIPKASFPHCNATPSSQERYQFPSQQLSHPNAHSYSFNPNILNSGQSPAHASSPPVPYCSAPNSQQQMHSFSMPPTSRSGPSGSFIPNAAQQPQFSQFRIPNVQDDRSLPLPQYHQEGSNGSSQSSTQNSFQPSASPQHSCHPSASPQHHYNMSPTTSISQQCYHSAVTQQSASSQTSHVSGYSTPNSQLRFQTPILPPYQSPQRSNSYSYPSPSFEDQLQTALMPPPPSPYGPPFSGYPSPSIQGRHHSGIMPSSPSYRGPSTMASPSYYSFNPEVMQRSQHPGYASPRSQGQVYHRGIPPISPSGPVYTRSPDALQRFLGSTTSNSLFQQASFSSSPSPPQMQGPARPQVQIQQPQNSFGSQQHFPQQFQSQAPQASTYSNPYNGPLPAGTSMYVKNINTMISRTIEYYLNESPKQSRYPTPNVAQPQMQHTQNYAMPHSQSNAMPHSQSNAMPHSQSNAMPHSQSNAMPHSQSNAMPHSQSSAMPHSQNNAMPHSQNYAMPQSQNNAMPHSQNYAMPQSQNSAMPNYFVDNSSQKSSFQQNVAYPSQNSTNDRQCRDVQGQGLPGNTLSNSQLLAMLQQSIPPVPQPPIPKPIRSVHEIRNSMDSLGLERISNPHLQTLLDKNPVYTAFHPPQNVRIVKRRGPRRSVVAKRNRELFRAGRELMPAIIFKSHAITVKLFVRSGHSNYPPVTKLLEVKPKRKRGRPKLNKLRTKVMQSSYPYNNISKIRGRQRSHCKSSMTTRNTAQQKEDGPPSGPPISMPILNSSDKPLVNVFDTPTPNTAFPPARKQTAIRSIGIRRGAPSTRGSFSTANPAPILPHPSIRGILPRGARRGRGRPPVSLSGSSADRRNSVIESLRMLQNSKPSIAGSNEGMAKRGRGRPPLQRNTSPREISILDSIALLTEKRPEDIADQITLDKALVNSDDEINLDLAPLEEIEPEWFEQPSTLFGKPLLSEKMAAMQASKLEEEDASGCQRAGSHEDQDESGWQEDKGESGWEEDKGESGWEEDKGESGWQKEKEPEEKDESGWQEETGESGWKDYTGESCWQKEKVPEEKDESGWQEETGESGWKEDTGESGWQEDKGESGWQEDKGESGWQEDTGESGWQEDKGESGWQEDKGESGWQEDKGKSGWQEDKGESGWHDPKDNSSWREKLAKFRQKEKREGSVRQEEKKDSVRQEEKDESSSRDYRDPLGWLVNPSTSFAPASSATSLPESQDNSTVDKAPAKVCRIPYRFRKKTAGPAPSFEEVEMVHLKSDVLSKFKRDFKRVMGDRPALADEEILTNLLGTDIQTLSAIPGTSGVADATKGVAKDGSNARQIQLPVAGQSSSNNDRDSPLSSTFFSPMLSALQFETTSDYNPLLLPVTPSKRYPGERDPMCFLSDYCDVNELEAPGKTTFNSYITLGSSPEPANYSNKYDKDDKPASTSLFGNDMDSFDNYMPETPFGHNSPDMFDDWNEDVRIAPAFSNAMDFHVGSPPELTDISDSVVPREGEGIRNALDGDISFSSPHDGLGIVAAMAESLNDYVNMQKHLLGSSATAETETSKDPDAETGPARAVDDTNRGKHLVTLEKDGEKIVIEIDDGLTKTDAAVDETVQKSPAMDIAAEILTEPKVADPKMADQQDAMPSDMNCSSKYAVDVAKNLVAAADYTDAVSQKSSQKLLSSDANQDSAISGAHSSEDTLTEMVSNSIDDATGTPIPDENSLSKNTDVALSKVDSFYIYNNSEPTPMTMSASMDITEDGILEADLPTSQPTCAKSRLLTYFIPPPSPASVQSSMSEYNIPEAHHPVAHCSNAADVPAKAVQLGGGAIVLKLQSKCMSTLPEFNGPLSSTGLSHWCQVIKIAEEAGYACSNDCIKSVNDLVKPRFHQGLHLEFHPRPPTASQVRNWLKEKVAESNCNHLEKRDSKQQSVTDNATAKNIPKVIVFPPAEISPISNPIEHRVLSRNAVEFSHGQKRRRLSFGFDHDVSKESNDDLELCSPKQDSLDSRRNASGCGRRLKRSFSEGDSTDVDKSLEDLETSGRISPAGPIAKKMKWMSSTPHRSTPMRESVSKTCSPTQGLLQGTQGFSLRRQLFLQQIKTSVQSETSQLQGPTPKNTYGFKMSGEVKPDTKSIHIYQNITLMSMELHVQTDEDFRPNPQNNAICAIFYHIQNDIPLNGDNKLKRQERLTGIIIAEASSTIRASSMGHTSASEDSLENDESPSVPNPKFNFHKHAELIEAGVAVHIVQNEFFLIQEFVNIIKEHDPDILLGYEIQMLSWGYLLERCAVIGIQLCSMLSRVPDDSMNIFRPPQEGVGDTFVLNIVGRIILNVWQILKSEIALYNYTFENLAYHVLHKRIPLFSFRTLTSWYGQSDGLNRWRTLQHYVIRVKGNVQLLEQTNFIGRTSELARLFGIQFYEVLSRGTQFRVESMLLRQCKKKKYIVVSPSVQQRSTMRSPEYIQLVMEPVSKFHTHPVVVLDFQSLYPSIIIAYNYCFSTCLGRVEDIGQSEAFQFGCTWLKTPSGLVKKFRDHISVAPCGVAFVKSEIRKGILPRMLEEILSSRIMVKTTMKQHKNDKALYSMLDARQLGLKLISNVTYGYTAANFSGRMPCVEIADSVVSKGRETLERAINLIHSTKRWNAKVVYGDTDSVFVLLEGRSKEQAFAIGNEIAQAVTADNPKPVKLKLEKVYLPCVLETKKRYVGNMYETPDQIIPVYDAKGIETVRRDGCPAVAKILEKTIRILFKTHDVTQVKTYVQNQFHKILMGRCSLNDYIFTREYHGRNGYRQENHAPAFKIARILLQSDCRAEPRVGERVPYVVTYGSPGAILLDLICHPHEALLNSSLRLNAKYYINNAICPALDRVLSLLGADVRQWYSSLPRSTRLPLPFENPIHEGGTILHHFTVTKCPVCEASANFGICPNCLSNPQKSLVVLTERIRQWERRYQQISTVCQGCTGTTDQRMSCVSLDCPVFFRLSQSSRDLAQAPYLRDILKKASLSW